MTIEEIKSVSIRQWLFENGYGNGFRKGSRLFYLSPLRKESNPSFCINSEENLWYDFAIQEGGNLINLVQKIHPEWNNHMVLQFLEQQIQEKGLMYSKDYEGQLQQAEEKQRWVQQQKKLHDNSTAITQITVVNHPHLRSYLHERRILYDIAALFCKEVHYIYNGKRYYAIGLENIEGGMEARNKFCKRCIGKKSISIIRPYIDEQKHCCVFEGFFDMLSYATLLEWGDSGVTISETCDYLVLNSTGCWKKLLPYLQHYQVIHCYLDNDTAGQNATQSIISAYPNTAIDESGRYKDYNDLNDYLCWKPKL